MRALTLHQPVATLMGFKDVENRKWKPPAKMLGQRIGIHAGKTWNPEYVLSAVRLVEKGIKDGPLISEAIVKAKEHSRHTTTILCVMLTRHSHVRVSHVHSPLVNRAGHWLVVLV